MTTPAIVTAPPTSIEASTGSPSKPAASTMPNTGTRLLNTAVREGPIAFTPSYYQTKPITVPNTPR